MTEVHIFEAGVTWPEIVVAVATFVLAVGAVAAAIGVGRQISLSRKQHSEEMGAAIISRELGFRPYLIAKAPRATYSDKVLRVQLSNIGPGPGTNITLTVRRSNNREVLPVSAGELTSGTKTGIAAGDGGNILIDDYDGKISDWEYIGVRFTYEDVFGHEFVGPSEDIDVFTNVKLDHA